MIRAEIVGHNRAVACGIEAVADAPVLALCRKLLAAGYDSAESLEAWRGDVLCLRVSSIGRGAALQVNELGRTRFVKYRSLPLALRGVSRLPVEPSIEQNEKPVGR